MFFKSSVNKHCDYANVYLSGNHIDFVQEVKYLGVLLNSSMKTSIDVSRQTRKFYAQANMLLRNFRYCGREVKCMSFKSFCTNMYCCPLWFNSTLPCNDRFLLIILCITCCTVYISHLSYTSKKVF